MHSILLFLLLVGGRNSYFGCDAFLGVSVFLPYWTTVRLFVERRMWIYEHDPADMGWD